MGLVQGELIFRGCRMGRGVELVAQFVDGGKGTLRPGGGGDPRGMFVDGADAGDEGFLRKGVEIRKGKKPAITTHPI